MKKYYIDTETCGLHSMCVLIQWAKDNGPINLHEVWARPARETLDLIDEFCTGCVVGFNLAFDWFHLCKLYTCLLLVDPDTVPTPESVKAVELEARDGPFLKPLDCFDLMLHARKGPYQSLMARKPVRIRRVPAQLAAPLIAELVQRVQIDDIHFARSKHGRANWTIQDVDGRPDLKNIVLTFSPAAGLKYLAEHVGLTNGRPSLFSEVANLPAPLEYGWAPAHGEWPEVIQTHIDHWAHDEAARQYAHDDVVYTRGLYEQFGSPTPGDDDSVLACMVGAVRWRGFVISAPGVSALLATANATVEACPINYNAPAQVRAYILDGANPITRTVLDGHALQETTGKATLKALAREFVGTELGNRAQLIIDTRQAAKEVELYSKLLQAGRFHASFTVIGTKSNRMSGSGGGLNPQGIKAKEYVRKCFPLAWDGCQLSGGDFDAFEVNIADAVYGDDKLHADLVNGHDIHQQFADVLGTDRKTGKIGVFATVYGGDENTLHKNLGVPLDRARAAVAWWFTNYPQIGKARERLAADYAAIRQPKGTGSAVFWNNPREHVESCLGFRRYFSLEYEICQALFNLAKSPPRAWDVLRCEVKRRHKMQTGPDAVSSALYGAAFAISGQCVRAAGNHLIQSPGGQITKAVQRAIWELQPCGAAPARVAPLNVHDEIMTVNDCPGAVAAAVRQAVESYRPVVPLIAMTWYGKLSDWSDKENGLEPMELKPFLTN